MIDTDIIFYNTGYQEYLSYNYANSVIPLKVRCDHLCGNSAESCLILFHSH